MKIAMFTDTYHPQFNGVVTSIDSFVKELEKHGHEVHIFAPASPNFKLNDKNARFVHYFKSFEFKPYPSYRVSIPISLMKYDFSSFDIIHVHTPAPMGAAGVLVAKRNKKPLVGTFHTLIPEYTSYISTKFMEPLARKALWKYAKFFYNKCDLVITPSKTMKKELLEHGIRKPTVVIPTGVVVVEARESKMLLRKKHGLNLNDKIILHVGRITREKNITLIIDAIEKLAKRNKNIKLIITSEGPYKKEIEKYVKKLGIEKNIIFTGFVSQKELSELYKLSDVFVVASKTETQGIVMIEAVANNLLIVALDARVIGDFIKETGTGFVASENNFAQTIEKALKTKIKDFAKKRKKTIQEYDPKTLAEKLINVYNELI